MKECVAEYRDIPVEEIPSYIENDPQLDVSVEDETAFYITVNKVLISLSQWSTHANLPPQNPSKP